MSLALTLGRATAGFFRAIAGTPPAPLPSPSAATTQLPSSTWRGAAGESPDLEEAVARMEEHNGMLRQIADAWLLAANVHSRDEADFVRNVRIADEMAHSIESECAAVVAELRKLALDDADRPASQRRAAQVQALIEWAHEREILLHQRLRELATVSGLDVGDLRAVHRTQIVGATAEEVEVLLTHFSPGSHPPLSLCLE
jgi:hypothetical protein